MKPMYILPAAMLGFALSMPALGEGVVTETQSKTVVEKDDDGSYHKKQTRSAESTDEGGTTTSSQTKVEVKSDGDGNAEKKVTTETSVDPKGLMNKQKTITTDSVKYKDGNVEKEYQKKVDGKTIEKNVEKTSIE